MKKEELTGQWVLSDSAGEYYSLKNVYKTELEVIHAGREKYPNCDFFIAKIGEPCTPEFNIKNLSDGIIIEGFVYGEDVYNKYNNKIGYIDFSELLETANIKNEILKDIEEFMHKLIKTYPALASTMYSIEEEYRINYKQLRK